MGCRNSSPLYKAKRQRSRRVVGKRRRPDPVLSQNISAQYPAGETSLEYQAPDLGEENNTERALHQHHSINQNLDHKKAEFVGGENEEKYIIHDDYPHQMILEDSFEAPPHSTKIPIVPKDYVAPGNLGTNIPENSTAPANNITTYNHKLPPPFPPNTGTNAMNYELVTPPVPPNTATKVGNYRAVTPDAPQKTSTNAWNYGSGTMPAAPSTGTKSDNYAAVSIKHSLISDLASPVMRTAQIPEDNNCYRARAMNSDDTHIDPQYNSLYLRGDSTLKRELESLSRKVDYGQVTKSAAKRVSRSYKVSPNSRTEYEKPEEKRIEKFNVSPPRISYQANTSITQWQPPKRDNTNVPVGKPVQVPSSSQFSESRPPREENIGSICFHAGTGEYRYNQRGVHMGNVDKEIAEKFSKNWPVCPSSVLKPVKHRRLQQNIPLYQHKGSNRKMPVPPARLYNYPGPQAQVYRGQPKYQSIGGYKVADNRYSNQGYRGHVLVQPSPAYRGYNM